MQAKKQILKASLRGIVELHDRDIAHLGKLSYFLPFTRLLYGANYS